MPLEPIPVDESSPTGSTFYTGGATYQGILREMVWKSPRMWIRDYGICISLEGGIFSEAGFRDQFDYEYSWPRSLTGFNGMGEKHNETV